MSAIDGLVLVGLAGAAIAIDDTALRIAAGLLAVVGVAFRAARRPPGAHSAPRPWQRAMRIIVGFGVFWAAAIYPSGRGWVWPGPVGPPPTTADIVGVGVGWAVLVIGSWRAWARAAPLPAEASVTRLALECMGLLRAALWVRSWSVTPSGALGYGSAEAFLTGHVDLFAWMAADRLLTYEGDSLVAVARTLLLPDAAAIGMDAAFHVLAFGGVEAVVFIGVFLMIRALHDRFLD